MAPQDTAKATPKLQRTLTKTTTKAKAATVKKVISKNSKEKILTKVSVNSTNIQSRQRTNTVPKVSTPKPKENRTVPMPATVTKSAKKANWKKRPKPAHSGVPVPLKMQRFIANQQEDDDCIL